MGTAAATINSVQEQLCAFKINGFFPFCGPPRDEAEHLLRQSIGLATMLSDAFDGAAINGESADLAGCRPENAARAFEAIATLNALALFVLEGGDA